MINPKQHGWQLIELLIALTIIGILTTLTVPLYTKHLVTARRLQAQHALAQLALAMEQYHLEHLSYRGATLASLHPAAWKTNPHYQFELAAGEDSYTLTATPINQQADRDARCGELTLNSLGEQGITGMGRVEECW